MRSERLAGLHDITMVALPKTLEKAHGSFNNGGSKYIFKRVRHGSLPSGPMGSLRGLGSLIFETLSGDLGYRCPWRLRAHVSAADAVYLAM
jgi:hypothetical protein